MPFYVVADLEMPVQSVSRKDLEFVDLFCRLQIIIGLLRIMKELYQNP